MTAPALDPALVARHAVYALARTQLDWIPTGSRPAHAPAAGFVHTPGTHTVTCPDCLADDFRHRFGCETCGGTGTLPGPDRDPMETKNATAVSGVAGERDHERRRWADAQLAQLNRELQMRLGVEVQEDWLTRALRVKDELWQRGDYRLLEQAQQLLGYRAPMRHLAWVTFVVEAQPLHLSAAAHARLDETADTLAAWMLASIGHQIEEMRALGRRRARPDTIRVPAEHWDAELRQAALGRGRWANGAAQGSRNALVLAMAADGQTAGEIARRVGLTKRRVQQLLAQHLEVATGPAA